MLGPIHRKDSFYSKGLQIEKKSDIKNLVDNFICYNSFSRKGKPTVLREVDHQIFKGAVEMIGFLTRCGHKLSYHLCEGF